MKQNLKSIAHTLMANNKGILAADEALPTIEKRFKSVGIPLSNNTRHDYRDMLLGTPGIEEYISGVILFDETIHQKSADGTPFPESVARRGIILGAKVDIGTSSLPSAPNEVVTEGLDGLYQRLVEYRKLGVRFAKWRAAIKISPNTPSRYCIETNAHALGRYAAICQEANVLPIVEPEVEMQGDHSSHRCSDITEWILHSVFNSLYEQKVRPEEILLKVNMVLPGKSHPKKASANKVATDTLRCLLRAVPAAVPGVLFLSGGQNDIEATTNLNEISTIGITHPWPLSFCYGRALQDAALRTWKGDTHNIVKARRAFIHRAKMNSAARAGIYTQYMEKAKIAT